MVDSISKFGSVSGDYFQSFVSGAMRYPEFIWGSDDGTDYAGNPMSARDTALVNRIEDTFFELDLDGDEYLDDDETSTFVSKYGENGNVTDQSFDRLEQSRYS